MGGLLLISLAGQEPRGGIGGEPHLGLGDVGERDIFPEEFPPFLAIPSTLRPAFLEAHGDLFGAAFWNRMQELAEAGEIVDFYPYPASRRLTRDGSSFAPIGAKDRR